jgi:hypothetical protein
LQLVRSSIIGKTSEIPAKRAGLYPFVGSGLCLLSVLLFGIEGCNLDAATCTAGERRCNGGQIEECTTHPSGTDVSADPPSASHHKSSPSTWEAQGSCGSADRCQTDTRVDEYGQTKADAFCSIEATRDPQCNGGSSYACGGTSPSSTLVTCREGFAIERQTCSTCDTEGDCNGGNFVSCKVDGDCAAGLTCVGNTCEMPCTCAEGADCASCNVLDETTNGPTQGAPFTWVCGATYCSPKYAD